MKICTKCKIEKPVDQFHKKAQFGKYISQCKSCKSEESRRWRQKNPNYMKTYHHVNEGKARLKHDEYIRAHPEQLMLTNARTRANRKNLECTIDISDIVIPIHCPILGIELKRGTRQDRDASPSLDRIDSSKGYVPGNVVVMSNRANRIKNNATKEELMKIWLWMTAVR